jgi:hypothetical protein
MLSAISIEDSSIILTSNYIGKDIVGQVGGLFYMNKMGKKADKEPRKFLLYSNMFQQSSIFVECITPLLPSSYFLPIAGVANMAKNISFTGFGAINARCIQILAEEDNIGEIYAKISVLNTVGSSIGMIVGLGLVAAIPDHSLRLCLLPFLAAVRIWTFKKAISGIINTKDE